MAEFAPTVTRLDDDVYLVIGYDVDGGEEIRDRALVAHLEYVEQQCDRYLVAGPLRNPGEDALIGSFFLVAANDGDEARAIVSGDPYVKNGLYRELIVHSATPAVGRLLGGVIWDSAQSLRDSMD
ncbi:MAG: YciI family protein [Woeseiaceae bacterium]|nr:YciI family protein [Woeseiaceae bacterium]